jgi:hypothetical protein
MIVWQEENCAFLVFCAVSSGNFLPTFWDSVSSGGKAWPPEDGTYKLFRNFDKKLSLLTA